jgi:hypothetical protein
MSELNTRINAIIQILADTSSKANKVVASLQAFSGMDITHFSEQKKRTLYSHMTTINNITSRYSEIKTYEDYKIISNSDLSKILKSIQQLCFKLLID